MPDATVVKPDLDFVKGVIAAGGESLKKCYQCATCSVVCKVTPDSKPFPRKEMIYAQWGLKDRLVNNPDIWLCHQCSDCTAYCPRGAKPGEVLGAIRKLSIQYYAFPQFLGRMVADAKYLPLLFVVPIIIFLVILASLGNLKIPDGEIVFSKFMPVLYVDAVFIPVASFATLAFTIGVFRFWKDINMEAPKSSLLTSIFPTIGEILLHKRFNKCELTKARSSSHLYVFYGFVGLAITTTWAIYYLYGLNWESPYPLTDPLKILGNFSGLLLLLGITLVITNRIKNKEKAAIGSYFDWLFITVVAVVAITGMLSQFLRLADIAVLAYPIYFVHLVFVFFLFAYAPYSKLAHLAYRATAMVYAKHSGRELEKGQTGL